MELYKLAENHSYASNFAYVSEPLIVLFLANEL